MKTLLIFSTLFLLFACKYGSTDHWDEEMNYEETKHSLEEQERSKPLSFMDVDGSYRQNFFGAFIVEGTIWNNATVAVYKDPRITFSFYSKTGTHLGDESLVWYEFIKPGDFLEFEEKFTDYDAASEVRIDITGAEAAD